MRKSQNRVNVHIYPSPFTNESRILRITQTLVSNNVFDKIYIIAGYKKGLKRIEDIDEIRTVLRLKTTLGDYSKGGLSKLLFLLEWTLLGFFKLLGKNLVCINSHCVSALPMAFFLKKVNKQSEIVYDAHEIETETSGKSGIMKKIAKVLEKHYIRKVDAMTIDGDGRANWYKNKYGIENVWAIKNYPYARNEVPPAESILKKYCNIGTDEILFIHQGMFGQGRGIIEILEAFAQTKPKNHIVFLGNGELTGKVQEYAKKYSNIHWHDSVPPKDVWGYSSGADAGIHIIENTCLNHYICLPNKVLEYLNSHIPIIISDFPEMASLVDNYDCGWKIQPDSKSLLELLDNITMEEILVKKQNAVKWSETNSWEGEEQKLIKMYEGLFNTQ